ncbi:MAG: hypothetical protein KGL90_14985 [Burkholderiales bacterium]|nr:hypothetical protein [Burkholderiales bacterium]
MDHALFLHRAIAIAALAAIGTAAHASVAIDTVLNFDAVASGTNANSAIGTLSSLIRFDNAVRVQDLDLNGDPIADQFHWEVDTDTTIPAVTVDNPIDFWRNAAPSGLNALNAAYGPVLMEFSSPLTLTHFSFTLENTPYGQPFADVLFLDNTGHVLQTLTFAQDQSGATVTAMSLPSSVSSIVLPAGKFVDDIHVSAVPEPQSAVLALLGLTALFGFSRRPKP